MAGHEDKDVARRVVDMDGDGLLDRLIHVVLHRSFGKVGFDREGPARNGVDLGVAEKVRELVGVHGGAGNDDLDISARLGHFDQDPEKHVGVETALVGLVHDDAAILLQIGVVQTLSQQDPVGHVFDLGGFGGLVFETDGVADFLPERSVHFFGHSFGDADGSHSSGLGAADHPVLGVAGLVKVLGELGGLP